MVDVAAVTDSGGRQTALPTTKSILGDYTGISGSTLLAYTALDELIWTGELHPGQRLIEAELADQIGIARTHVRDALKHLASDGLVELLRNRGARVRKLSPKDFYFIGEALIASLLASVEILIDRPALDHADLDRLRALVRRIEDQLEDGDIRSFSILTAEYHVVVNEMTGNMFLNLLLARLHLSLFHREIVRIINIPKARDGVETYRLLTEAIASRDLNAARAILSKHKSTIKLLLAPSED